MLKVAEYEIIRRKVKREGMSQREAAKELGHSRKTVAKALRYSSPPGYIRTKPAEHPVTGPYIELIMAWMKNDAENVPKKQHHSAQRIYERLCEDHGYKGSYDAIQRFVKKLKRGSGERFFPLGFDPAEEAQVDWGVGWLYENNRFRKAHIFHMRMCYSKAAFSKAYEKETIECFLDGHVKAFEYFKGVPGRLAYDNLKTAVIQVGRGRDRKLNPRFIELRSHYLFESRFCNPAKGNEKGIVENQVKRTQKNYLTPVPHVSSLEELNIHLLKQCERDLECKDQNTGLLRKDMLAYEKRLFIELPPVAFEACASRSTFVDAKSIVRFDNNNYSAALEYSGHRVTIKGFVNKIRIYSQGELIAEHDRCYGSMKYILNFEHYIKLLRTKPGGIYNAIPFKNHPWGKDMAKMWDELKYRYGEAGTRKFIEILLMIPDRGLERVCHAVKECIRMGAFDDGAVRSLLAYKPKLTVGQLDLRHRPELLSVGEGTRKMDVYDSLLKEVY